MVIFFDDNKTPLVPVPKPWLVGEHQVWVEPIRMDYGVVVVYAQKHPHVVGEVLFLPERIDMMHECLDDHWGCRRKWEPFDRAVESAIADAERRHKQRAETE